VWQSSCFHPKPTATFVTQPVFFCGYALAGNAFPKRHHKIKRSQAGVQLLWLHKRENSEENYFLGLFIFIIATLQPDISIFNHDLS
jgi:hypothetical protein